MQNVAAVAMLTREHKMANEQSDKLTTGLGFKPESELVTVLRDLQNNAGYSLRGINRRFNRAIELACKDDKLLRRTEVLLEWAVKDTKQWYKDNCNSDVSYSEELTEAINLLDEIRKVNK